MEKQLTEGTLKRKAKGFHQVQITDEGREHLYELRTLMGMFNTNILTIAVKLLLEHEKKARGLK